MDFFSESYFREITNRMPLNEQRTFSANAQRAPLYKQFDIFLSYNIADLAVVTGIYYLLTRNGHTVYLDKIVDPDLDRNATDKKTAERIQNRLKHSRSLLYAQSPSANQSNWMPWELGVVDGNTGRCMIMPVTKDQTSVNPRREYLLLYPYVKPNYKNEMRVFTEGGSILGITIKDYIS